LPSGNGNDAAYFESNRLNDAIKNRCQSYGNNEDVDLVMSVGGAISKCHMQWGLRTRPKVGCASGCTVFPAKTVCSDWCSQ